MADLRRRPSGAPSLKRTAPDAEKPGMRLRPPHPRSAVPQRTVLVRRAIGSSMAGSMLIALALLTGARAAAGSSDCVDRRVAREIAAGLQLGKALKQPLERATAAFFLSELRRDRWLYRVVRGDGQPGNELRWDPRARHWVEKSGETQRIWSDAEVAAGARTGRVIRTPNAAGAENLGHIRRLYEKALRAAPELRQAGVDVDAVINGILASDLGKTRLAEIVTMYRSGQLAIPGVQREWAPGDFFAAFMRHEDYGLVLLHECMTERGRALGLPESVVHSRFESTRGAILGHNGPATPGSFWKWAHEMLGLGEYAEPVTREGWVHALLDRSDQARVFYVRDGSGAPAVAGGPRKILLDIVAKNDGRSFPELVEEAFHLNAQKTLGQIERLMQLGNEDPAFAGLASLALSRAEVEGARGLRADYDARIRIQRGRDGRATGVSVRQKDGAFRPIRDSDGSVQERASLLLDLLARSQ